MRSSVLGTLLVVAVEGLEASGGGPSVSSGTRFASGSSSSAAFSSAIVEGAAAVDFEGVVACTAIAGTEKLNHRLRKRAIGRTACLGLSGLIKEQGHLVLWGSFVMFVRLDYRWTALVSRNCQWNDVSPW